MTSVNALLESIKARDLDAVTALLDAERGLAAARPDDGPTPVLMAAYVGADDIVALLRAHGTVLDVFEAAVVGDAERLGALIDEADRVNAYSAEGWTPLHLACFFGRAADRRAAGAGGAAHRNGRRPNPDRPGDGTRPSGSG